MIDTDSSLILQLQQLNHHFITHRIPTFNVKGLCVFVDQSLQKTVGQIMRDSGQMGSVCAVHSNVKGASFCLPLISRCACLSYERQRFCIVQWFLFILVVVCSFFSGRKQAGVCNTQCAFCQPLLDSGMRFLGYLFIQKSIAVRKSH